jgi:hypothetical protein
MGRLSVTEPEGQTAGSAVIVLGQVGTALMVMCTLMAAVLDVGAAQIAYLVACTVLFVAGCAAFAVGFLRAAGRSRTETIDLAGLFYLTGAAPVPVRRMLLGLWFTQIAVATVSVAVTPAALGGHGPRVRHRNPHLVVQSPRLLPPLAERGGGRMARWQIGS